MGPAAFLDIWINCPDRETAERIAGAAIERKLAACANLFPAISSLYRWKGTIERADEVPLLLKSRAAHFDAVSALVKSLHPYETPSIVASELPRVEANYAGWLHAETATAATEDGEYRPRPAWFRELVQAGPATIKLNAICANGKRIGEDDFARAKARILSSADEIAATPHLGAGFAILHEGDEGRWLLLHWWIAGGIATRRLWRADIAPGSAFVDADPLLMACVWELGVIDFERRAWMRTAMGGGAVSDYIEDRFSEGSV